MKNISSTKNRSMSDADSQTSQVESFHSPLHSDSPFPPPDSKAIVAVSVDKYYSPLRSPPRNNHHKHQDNLNFLPPPTPPPVSQSSKVMYNRSLKENMASGVTKVGPAAGGEDLGEEGVGGERKPRPAVPSIPRRSRKDVKVERAALGFRGWSGDSFDRYKEYRYCLSVAVISFVYSGFQAYDLAYHLVTGKHVISHHLRYHFDFLMDQILAYLLLSASSSAATRVDDWVSNWGKDQFTEMASASVGMAFLGFATFALSSLISGYNLCNRISSGL